MSNCDEVIRRLDVVLASDELRRWERWVLCRIRERLVAGGMTAATRENAR